MLDWLKQHFDLDPFDSLTIFISPDGSQLSSDSNWLSNQLGSTVPPTYATLSALPIASQGWQKIFDQWKDKSIVS